MISQPAVPETALKRRKRDEAWAAKKATADAEAAAASKKNSEEIFKRAEKYVKEYRDQVSARIPASRRSLGGFFPRVWLGSGFLIFTRARGGGRARLRSRAVSFPPRSVLQFTPHAMYSTIDKTLTIRPLSIPLSLTNRRLTWFASSARLAPRAAFTSSPRLR